jgi:hypothetical protein
VFFIFHTLKRELDLTTPVMNQTVINKRYSERDFHRMGRRRMEIRP